jgi:hypothetical protein
MMMNRAGAAGVWLINGNATGWADVQVKPGGQAAGFDRHEYPVIMVEFRRRMARDTVGSGPLAFPGESAIVASPMPFGGEKHRGRILFTNAFLEASMSGPDATATPFVGSDRRFEILDRLAARAQATPPATTPQAIASGSAAAQMTEPPGEDDENEGGEFAKPESKDDKDSADRKGILDGRPPPPPPPSKVDKDEEDSKSKEASDKDEDADKGVSDKPGEKEVQDAKDVKDTKDSKDAKDKEASDKDQDKDALDNKNEKDVKDVKDVKDKDSSIDKSESKEGDKEDDKDDDKDDKEGDKDDGDKGDDTGTGTFTAEFVDPGNREQLAESSADSPPAGDVGRPASLLTRLTVV